MSRSSDQAAAALFSKAPAMARPSTARTPPSGPPAVVFRAAIEKAEQAGTARKDMTLRLTLRDAAELKRDRTLALEDISFADGVMTFLGVKVASGGVPTSVLDADAA
jgi:Flp pilus assembly protein CpaB